MHLSLLMMISFDSVFAYGAGGCVSVPSEVIFLITVSVIALKTVTFHLVFSVLHLFVVFLY